MPKRKAKPKRESKPKKYVEGLLHGVLYRVSLRPGSGGAFESGIAPGGVIMIGWDQPWGVFVGALFHEAFEVVTAFYGWRWDRWDTRHVDMTALRFFLSHDDFTVLTDHVGPFVADMLPPLLKLWKAAQKKAKTGR